MINDLPKEILKNQERCLSTHDRMLRRFLFDGEIEK